MTGDEESKQLILKIAKRIEEQYKPKKIILFGSYAYGEPTQDSDVDLLIIKNTDKRPIDRWVEVKKLLRGIAPGLPISPLVYTEGEIDERNAIQDFFIEEIFENGEVIYG
jgi:predicted nucleotidyltransferase